MDKLIEKWTELKKKIGYEGDEPQAGLCSREEANEDYCLACQDLHKTVGELDSSLTALTSQEPVAWLLYIKRDGEPDGSDWESWGAYLNSLSRDIEVKRAISMIWKVSGVPPCIHPPVPCDKDAEIERLENINEQFSQVMGGVFPYISKGRRLPDAELAQEPARLAHMLGKMEAEIERLREALEEIVNLEWMVENPKVIDVTRLSERFKLIAETALKGDSEEVKR